MLIVNLWVFTNYSEVQCFLDVCYLPKVIRMTFTSYFMLTSEVTGERSLLSRGSAGMVCVEFPLSLMNCFDHQSF